MSWNYTQIEATSSAIARGPYGTPTNIAVDDTAATEIVAAATTGQYFSISNAGPSSVFCRFNGTATSTVYSVIFPPGFNDNQMRVAANENVTVITATGKTANLLVSVAAEVQI